MAGGSRSELGSSRGDDTVRRLGRYQIIGRLATGGMAEVYLALSGDVPGFRTLVVLKRILPLIEPTRFDLTLKKFSNYDELWHRP